MLVGLVKGRRLALRAPAPSFTTPTSIYSQASTASRETEISSCLTDLPFSSMCLPPQPYPYARPDGHIHGISHLPNGPVQPSQP
jgi:hypothetical protein